VVLCELSSAVEPTAVDVVAASLGIDARPGVPLTERLASVLDDGEVVLVLDNCEHVLEPVAALVEHLLASCPNVTVLATSQERLRVAGEHLWPVPPLVVDEADPPAVALFIERARSVAPGFDPDQDDLACIAEIVQRLDGLPLAIELAAARLHTHDLAEIAAGLDSRFALLSAGYRSSSRHGSLHAAVAWSYALLDPALQQTLAALSTFVGPFTVDDAAAICALDPTTTGAHLAQLTERSLVLRTPERRYRLLETLRAFGLDQLGEAGLVDVVAERHARHAVAWAERADERLLVPGDPVVAEIDGALPELWTALGWLLEHGEIELAGRLVHALLDYAIMRLRPDVLAWAERVAAADPEDRSPVAARVWVSCAYGAWMNGDVPGCGERAARALRASGAATAATVAEVAAVNGNVALFEGRLDEAVAWYQQSIDEAAAVGDVAQQVFMASTQLLAMAYGGDPAVTERAEALLAEFGAGENPHAAYLWFCAGEADLAVDVDRARERYARAEELAELTHASFVTGLAGASRVSIDARDGDPVAAAADYRRLIDHWRRAGMWSTQWTMLRSIAGLLARLQRWWAAAVLVGAVQSTEEGHRIFGADEVALRALEAQLRTELGDAVYEDALVTGAALDGDAATEHALRAL
jgi:predicted ATPase